MPESAPIAESSAAAVIGEVALEGLRGKLILLAGATGRNGRVVLRQLVELGLTVRAMSRDVARARARHGDRVEWVEGDVTRPKSLERAVAGVGVVISSVATAAPFGDNRPERVDFEGTTSLAEAARRSGVTRMVLVTSSVSGRRGGLLNFIGRNVLVWKGEAEKALMRSGLEYVVVGPARLNDHPGGQREIRVIPRADYQRGMAVTRADLASVVIAAAGLAEAANRTFSVINTDRPANEQWRARFAAMPAT